MLSNLTLLADILGKEKDMPKLREDSNATRIDAAPNLSAVSTASPFAAKEGSAENSIWDDEDTKSFYENLPDLKALLPGVLFSSDRDKEIIISTNTKEPSGPNTPATDESGSANPSTDITLDNLIARLPNCVNRDLIDQTSIEFCYVNNKTNRKKLVKALFNVPRTALSLIPHYSRMVANLSQCMKDVGTMLVALLEEEFNAHYQKKDQINIETKIRNIRFIGELTKFKICPPSATLNFLKLCLDDFVHHNIDIACNLLETCGRFLYKTPETHVRTKNLLEMMMRLKSTQNLQNRLDAMVENAYYQCIPPEKSTNSKKQLPPIRQYIRKLIYEDLNKNSAKYILRQLRKLPWAEEEDFIVSTLVKIYKGKYNNIHLVASIVSGLTSYHELVGIKTVDALLENIRSNLESNDFTQQQRQITNMKYLGELYNYCVIESSVIFDTLYFLLFFGHPLPLQGSNTGDSPASESTSPMYSSNAVDPPTDCFRIRIVCTLLDTCGQYFDRGTSKKKLDRYLVYFQRYILSKSYIPMDVDFMISDTLEALRPNLLNTRFSSFEQANQEVIKLEKESLSTPLTTSSLVPTIAPTYSYGIVRPKYSSTPSKSKEATTSSKEKEADSGSDREGICILVEVF